MGPKKLIACNSRAGLGATS
jgi:hypothetical protein